MEEVIICPNCGETNSADLPYCRSCQWRLHSLDSEWGPDEGSGTSRTREGKTSNAVAGDSLPDWLQQPAAPASPANSADEAAAARLRERLEAEGAEDLMSAAPEPGNSEDFLAGLSRAEQSEDEPIPDWVARIMGISEDDDPLQAPSRATGTQADSISGAKPGQSLNQDASAGLPWLDRDMGAQSAQDEPQGQDAQFGSSSQVDPGTVGRESDDVYAWLRQLDENNAASPGPISRTDVAATTDVPTWVGRMMGVSAAGADEEEESRSTLPDWLKTPPQADDTPAAQRRLTPEPPPMAIQPPANEPIALEPEVPPTPMSPSGVAAEVPSSVTTPGSDSFDVDAVFAAMEMPHWSSSTPAQVPSGQEAAPPAAHDAESIAPADLPSWVQAMRPVESSVASIPTPEAPLLREGAGPLLGLNGVLPSAAGLFVPSTRPQSQAMRLEVSEQQRAQARLLEDLLEAETRPLPLQGPPQPRAPRLIRWLVSGIVLGSVALGLVPVASRFQFPAGVPSESNAAIQVVQNLAPDTAVLAVFDYEPATAGEMEVAGSALMDHLLLLKHPRLALISTSPTGSALAEKFISTTLRERAYVRDVQYADLGLLPGGLAGAQLFAQNPAEAVPYGAGPGRVWDGQVLKGASGLSDFGAIIVLTDSQENGTVWIEQTTGRRGAVPLIMVASAQAGPMLLPYYDSGQLQGLVIGINGAAAAEMANGGNPGLVRRYWDAYNIGVYAAVALIVLGSMWQLAAAAMHRGSDRA